MKDKILLLAVTLAIISLLLGLIGKFSGSSLYFANSTWHTFAQTCLLFAIAWGLGKSTVTKEN